MSAILRRARVLCAAVISYAVSVGLKRSNSAWHLLILCCALTSGCAIPIVKSTPLPNVELQLPADLRASGNEVLVVKQMSRSSWSQVLLASDEKHSSRIVTADFVKGNELASVSKKLKVDSDVALLVAVPIPVAPIGLSGVGSSERLENVCVITPDGQMIKLSLGAFSFAPALLDAGRRDAIVTALRAGGNNPFVGVDGPCGVWGTVEWSAELRLRIIEFLDRIPPVAAGTDVNDLGPIQSPSGVRAK